MTIINHQLNLFIIPFAFENHSDFKEIVRKVDLMKFSKNIHNNNDNSVWKKVTNNSEERFFEHITQLIPSNSITYESTIGSYWRLNPLAREEFKLPKNPNNTILFHSTKKEDILLKIIDVQLFLFETGIGFLIYEINYPKIKNLDDLILANYLLKRLKNFGGNMQLQRLNNKRDFEIGVNFSEICTLLLEPISITSYFEKEDKEPKNAIVFTTIILDKSFIGENQYEAQLKRYLFEASRAFKKSYQLNERGFDVNEGVYKPFDNSVWGISLEGASNIVYQTNNDITNRFFSEGYIKNIKINYFYMYILALHQRYALLNFSIRAARIPRKMEMLVQSTGVYQSVLQLQEDIAYFDLRSSFLHISHVTHQDRVYQCMYQALCIKNLYQKLHSEVDSITTLMEIRRGEIEKENKIAKDKQIKRNDNFYVTITTFFVCISTLSSLWSLYKDFWNSSWAENVFWISFFVIGILAIIGVLYKQKDE